MKWNASKPNDCKIGDTISKIKFALFPKKVGEKWIWLERYIQHYKYCEYYWNQDVVVSKGIFTEKYYTKQVESVGWIKTHKEILTPNQK